jgi:GntR family transcriptional regulator
LRPDLNKNSASYNCLMNPPSPLYIQIQSFIRQGIHKGHFKEGDRLPSEQELAERFATTRATVARALQQLVFEKVILRRSGSGTFVSPRKLEVRVDTSVLESFEDHVLGAGESLRYELLAFEASQADEDVAERLGLAPEALIFDLERLRIINDGIVALELRHVPESIARGIRKEWLLEYSIQYVLNECLGLRIGQMENAVSATIASSDIARILNVKKGDALLVREHTIYDQQGRALLYGKTLYPGQFSVRYTLGAKARA